MGTFEITHWRTVNWHNLLTQQQAVIGDIFNLGPNESGKTTLEDGIHAALSLGEPHMEWNSAADPTASATRLKREGRTLRDIIFRVNQTWANETPSIVYFGIELTNRATGEIFSIGVGAYAQTMKSDVIKWGFVIPTRLKDVQLTNKTGEIVHDQEALEAIYGNHAVLTPRRFRQRVSELLYGGLADYDTVLSLLNLGKSYNRLVQQSDNFSVLFRGALPEPNPADFESARAQLQTIAAIRSAIESLRDQKKRLDQVQALVNEVQRHRAALVRYDLRDVVTELEREEATLRHADKSIEDLTHIIGETTGQHADTASKIETQEAIIRDLERSGVDELQHSLQEAQREHDRAEVRLNEAIGRANEATRNLHEKLDAGEAAWNKASASLSTVSRALAEQKRNVPTKASSAFALLFEDIQKDLQHPTRERPVLPDSFRTHLDNLDELVRNELHRLSGLRQDQELKLEALRRAQMQINAQLETLANQVDVPPIEAAAVATRGLESRTRLLYQHVEYDLTREREAALLEAFLPSSVLAAIIPTNVEDTDRLRSIIEARAPCIKIVDLSSLGHVEIPPDSILFALDRQRTHPDVLAYLASEYGNVRLCAPGIERKPGERIVWTNGEVYDGHAWNLAEVPTQPRFVGAQARARALAARKAELERQRLENETARLEAEQGQERLAQESDRLKTLRDEIRASLNRTRIYEHLANLEKIRGELAGLSAIKEHEEAAILRERTEYQGRRERLLSLQRMATASGAAEKLYRLQAANSAVTALRREQSELDQQLGSYQNEIRRQIAIRDRASDEIGPLRDKRKGKFDELAKLLHLPGAEVEAYLRETGFYRMKNAEQKRGETHTAIGNAQTEIETQLVELSAKRSLRYDRDRNAAFVAVGGRPLGQVIEELEANLAEKDVENVEATRVLSQKIIVEGIAASIKDSAIEMAELIDHVNAQLSTADFRGVTFRIKAVPVNEPKTAQLRKLILESSAEASQETLADFIRVHLEATSDETEIPRIFDYRQWYDFTIRTAGATDEQAEDRTAKGSGGRQAVPKYLFVFCLFSLIYDRINSRLRLVFIDEAFQRVDPGNIDQLIRFAKKRGLLLVVTNTELDGATEAMGASTVNMFHKNERDETFILPWTKMATGVYVR